VKSPIVFIGVVGWTRTEV